MDQNRSGRSLADVTAVRGVTAAAPTINLQEGELIAGASLERCNDNGDPLDLRVGRAGQFLSEHECLRQRIATPDARRVG